MEDELTGEEINEGESWQEGPISRYESGECTATQVPSSSSGVTPNESSFDYIQYGTWSGYLGAGEEGYPGFWLNEQQEEVKSEKPCISETEESSYTETKEKSEATTPSSEALSNVYSKLSPFTIHWAFGVNRNVEIINLTTADTFEVFYASSHYAVLFNYQKNTMTFLPGHNYVLTSISSDSSGRWLVTADAGEDTVIVVWDKKKILPAWCLYNVFPGEGVKSVKISQDGRFLAAINCNFNFTLKFWMWTYGRQEPDGEFPMIPEHGKANHIDFNHNKTEQFVATLELHVIFFEWNQKTKTLESFVPKFENRMKKIGVMRKSLFLDDGHTVLTSTSLGFVVVWNDLKYNEINMTENPGTINKTFLEVFKFHKSAITSLSLCDNFIATASEEGTVSFHDQNCQLMYFIPKMKVGPLISVSFNIEHVCCSWGNGSADTSENEEIQNVLEYDASNISVEKHHFLSEEFKMDGRDELLLSSGSENRCQIIPRTDCTYEAKPIAMRDFMFMSANGKIGYMSIAQEKVRYYLSEVEGVILSLDCHPRKPHLMLGTSAGRIILYDYQFKRRLLLETFSTPVTTLKYSSLGYSIVAGFQNGELLELNSILLQVLSKVDTSRSPIVKICISAKDDLLAYYDQSSTVHVLKKSNQKWASMGKYISHYKPIVDILLQASAEDPNVSRLFTIGEDRMLVEYDMVNLEENKLKILTIIRIEQTAIPRCFMWMTKCYKTPHFIVSNDQYKLKVLDAETHMCQKTTLGPTADTPINFMRVIEEENPQPEKAKMIYATDKHIGIRILPPTGNPFEGMGMVAHPEKVIAFAISYDHKYAFTVGVRDTTPLMWGVNAASVDVASHLGGTGLEPFVSLIEGGPNSFLFKEMEDFFYYAQIIHQGEDPNTDRSVCKELALCEIPDLFRALGYFPTEYEINNLLHELRHLNFDKTGQLTEEISFEECIKAFLNHRWVHGISLTDINNALLAIADLSDPSDIIIERTEMYKTLEERAEAMDHAEVVGYFCILLLPSDEENPVPHNIKLNTFAEMVLGIDLTVTEEKVREITHSFETK